MAGELLKVIPIGQSLSSYRFPSAARGNSSVNMLPHQLSNTPVFQSGGSEFDVIKFLSESMSASPQISQPVFENLMSNFLGEYDKQLSLQVPKPISKFDKQKENIINWLQKDGDIQTSIFNIYDFDFVKKALNEQNIDIVTKVIKYLKANKNIKPNDKYNIVLASILASNKNNDLIPIIEDVLLNPKISYSKKAQFILGLKENINYSVDDLKFDLKADKITDWINKHINNVDTIIEIRDIKKTQKCLNEGNIDFISELINKMNEYIKNKKINLTSPSSLTPREIKENNENLLINSVNIVMAAVKLSSGGDEFNAIIEKVIKSNLPDETKARFITAIPNNPEFAADLLNYDKLGFKVENDLKSDILENATNKNVNIIREIIEKKLVNPDYILSVVSELSNGNLKYVREILSYDISDEYKPDILSAANKNTIKVIRKIMEMENLNDDNKADIIGSLDNSNFKEIYSLVKAGNIPAEHIRDIIPYVTKRNRYHSKKIINDSNLPFKFKGVFLANINNQTRDICFDVIYDNSIEEENKDSIISNINSDNKKYAREIIWHKNINSNDTGLILPHVNDESIDTIRKVINNPDIPSVHMGDIISSLISNKENIPENLSDKILNSKDIEPCYKSVILYNLIAETNDLSEKIIDDKRINGYYKSIIISLLNSNNKYWVENLLKLKYDDFRFIAAAINLDYELEDSLVADYREAVLKSLDTKYEQKIYKKTIPDLDNYEGNESWINSEDSTYAGNFEDSLLDISSEITETPKENADKHNLSKGNKNFLEVKEDDIEKIDTHLYIGKLEYYLEKFPNMFIFDICDLVLENTLEEFNKETGKLYTQKRSIVKTFPKNISEETILKKTDIGDVIEHNNQLYINEGDKLFKWNMTKEKFDDLFPAGERLLLKQGKVGDCYLLSVLLSLINNPLGKIYLYKSFEQNGNDILCTIRSYKEYGGTKNYPNGELPKVDTRLEGCKGLQMLEHTYAEVSFRSSAGVNNKNNEFLKNLDRIAGGEESTVFMELTGVQEAKKVNEHFKHKVIVLNSDMLQRDILDKYVNSKNCCSTISFLECDEKYDILANHSYFIKKYDKANDAIIIMNTHDSRDIIVIPYSKYVEMEGELCLCNLEESEE